MSEEQTPVEAPVEVTETATQPGILNDEGNFNSDWLQGLPEELGNHSIFQKYTNPVDLAKGAINAQSMVGGKLDDFWSSENENDIAKRKEIMGIPSSIDDYNIDVELPEGIEISDDRIAEFKQLAYENGISADAAQALINFDIQKAEQDLSNADKDYNVSLDEAEATLREEWKGDDYEYNLSKVGQAMDFLNLGEFKDDPGIANNTEFIKALFENIVPLIGNDELIQARNDNNFASIQDQLNVIDQQMNNYSGNRAEASYQQLGKQRLALLEKEQEIRTNNS
tara:strand:+ start:12696 stop:13541 length:846 start_codon:yes stop_codon:yes gene_type:complete